MIHRYSDVPEPVILCDHCFTGLRFPKSCIHTIDSRSNYSIDIAESPYYEVQLRFPNLVTAHYCPDCFEEIFEILDNSPICMKNHKYQHVSGPWPHLGHKFTRRAI